MFLYILSPSGKKSLVLTTASKRDQGLDGVGGDAGVVITRSKSPVLCAPQYTRASMQRSRASMPTSRMLLTAMRTIDSQSLQPVGDLIVTVGSFWPFLSRVSISLPSLSQTGW